MFVLHLNQYTGDPPVQSNETLLARNHSIEFIGESVYWIVSAFIAALNPNWTAETSNEGLQCMVFTHDGVRRARLIVQEEIEGRKVE